MVQTTLKLQTTVNTPFSPIVVNGIQSGVIAIRLTPIGLNRLATRPVAKLQQILLSNTLQLVSESKSVPIAGVFQFYLLDFRNGYTIRIDIPDIADSVQVEVREVTGFTLTNQSTVVIPGDGDMTFDPALYYTKTEVDTLLSAINLQLQGVYTKAEVDALIAAIGNGNSANPLIQLTYVSDGDTNGVLYWLGTNKGFAAWSNPHDSGQIAVSASSTPAPLGGFVNRQLENIFVNNFPEPVFLQVDLKTVKLKPTGYLVRARSDDFSRPQNFGMYGSESPNGPWTLLDSQATALANSAYSYRAVSTAESYRYFRIQQDGLNQGGEKYLTLCEIEWYGDVFSL